MADLLGQIRGLRWRIPGCESLTVASQEGLVLATTHDPLRHGELLAAVTSLLLADLTRGLAAFQAGGVRALDVRGDRQVLFVGLAGTRAFLVCVLVPGAPPIGLNDALLTDAIRELEELLRGAAPPRAPAFFLERDGCRYPIGARLLLGRSNRCDVVLAEPEVDEEHLLLEVTAEGVVRATEVGRNGGARVNRRHFEGAPIELCLGDRLVLPGVKKFTLVGQDGAIPLATEGARGGKGARKGSPGRRRGKRTQST